MCIRRPLAGLFLALTLFGGSAATLSGCTSPTSGHTGTPVDTAKNMSGAHPSSSSQGKLPDNSNREPSSSRTNGRQGAGGG